MTSGLTVRTGDAIMYRWMEISLRAETVHDASRPDTQGRRARPRAEGAVS